MSTTLIEKPSIGEVMRTVIEASTETEVDAIADEIMATIDPEDYGFYLRAMVSNRVSGEMSYLLKAAMPPLRRNVSTKQQLIRNEYWPKFLQQKIALPGGYKTLAEATADDLRFVASMRKTQANELLNRAEQFDTLADLMEKSKVTYLEQLDPKAAQQILGAAA